VAERENFVVLHGTERGNVTDTVAVPAVILRWRWLKPWGSGEAHALATEYRVGSVNADVQPLPVECPCAWRATTPLEPPALKPARAKLKL
jgi:hypothetical protein